MVSRSHLCGAPEPQLERAIAPSWRSPWLARLAIEQNLALVLGHQIEGVEATSDIDVRCLLRDRRQRPWELLLCFESSVSSLSRVRAARALGRHRGASAGAGGRRGAEAPGAYRIAYAHYSRSDPETRNSGSLIHLIQTLFRDVYPVVDQFISLVDVRNAAGLRLSFGRPWPTCVRRLFLPARALATRAGRPPKHALFVSDGHERTQWLVDLAEASDTHAVCAPPLERPAPPSGPVYCDHVVF